MKKLLLILILTLTIALAVSGTAICYAESTSDEAVDGEVSWKVYLEEKLIPQIILVVTNFAGQIVVYLPAIALVWSKLKPILTAFGVSHGDLKVVLKEYKEMLARLESQDTIIAGLESEYKKQSETLDYLSEIMNKIDKKTTIALCQGDTVSDGTAREICKIDSEVENEVK